MKATDRRIHEIDPDRVKVFVHRERVADDFERITADIGRRGQIHPGQVRDIRHLPKEERAGFDYQLVTGEGRLLAAKELKRKFRAFIVEQKEVANVGFFLAENLNREALPWAEKARLVKPLLDAGQTPEEIAERHSISVGHVLKFRRILDKTASGLAGEVAGMPMNEAEAFTTLPATDQAIVMEVFRETKDAQIRELVKRAKAVTEETGKPLSKTALSKSLQRIDEDLKRVREKLKVARLHWGLGPQNLVTLLADRKFRKALEAEGVNMARFDKTLSL